jgi:hypothetical protein
MKRLILTTDTSGAGSIGAAGLADFVISLERRLVWGPPLSRQQCDAYFAARTAHKEGANWRDHTPAWRLEPAGGKGLGLIEFCAGYEIIEPWIDPDPNAQLNLIRLLNYLRAHEQLVSKMKFIQADFTIGRREPEELAKWPPPRVNVSKDHVDLASAAWCAYRASTPTDFFKLLETDLSPLPRLRRAVAQLLEELPSRTTGLSATEMWMLELISTGEVSPSDIFTGLLQREERGTFHYWEIGELLDGLAHCPAPAVDGLNEGPFTMELHDDRERHRRYNRSKLSLTPFGKGILAEADDFSRHNPIHRWWGGTELTNDRLWRWDTTGKTLIAP